MVRSFFRTVGIVLCLGFGAFGCAPKILNPTLSSGTGTSNGINQVPQSADNQNTELNIAEGSADEKNAEEEGADELGIVSESVQTITNTENAIAESENTTVLEDISESLDTALSVTENVVQSANHAPVAKQLEASVNPIEAYMGKRCIESSSIQSLSIPVSGEGAAANEAFDEDGDSLIYAVDIQAEHGEVHVVSDIDGTSFVYTPTAGYSGDDSFTYYVSDGLSNSVPETATIHIKAQESKTLNDYGVVLETYSGHFSQSSGIGAPSVVFVPSQNKYVMFYETAMSKGTNSKCGGTYQIGRSESIDGIQWSLDESPTIIPAIGNFYECGAVQPAILYDGQTFHLFFSSKKLNDKKSSWQGSGIGYATSSDGVTFSIPSNLLSNEVTGANTLSNPSAIQIDDNMRLYFWKKDSTTKRNQIRSITAKINDNSGNITFDSESNLILEAEGDDASNSNWSTGSLWQSTSSLESAPGAFCRFENGSIVEELVMTGKTDSGNSATNQNPNKVFGAVSATTDGDFTVSSTLDTVANSTDFKQAEVIQHGNNQVAYYVEISSGLRRIRVASTYQSAVFGD